MCGRITRTSPRETIAKEFGVTRFAEVDWHPRYNVAPSHIVETIISVPGEKRLEPTLWGFVPPTVASCSSPIVSSANLLSFETRTLLLRCRSYFDLPFMASAIYLSLLGPPQQMADRTVEIFQDSLRVMKS